MGLRDELHRAIDEVLDSYGEPEAESGHAFYVDAGHGGRDPGASVSGGIEKEIALMYAMSVAAEFKRRGHTAYLSRESDAYPTLIERAKQANELAVEAFLSIHANASANEDANGAWVIHAQGSAEGERLAREIFRRLAQIPGVTDADPEEEVYADATPWVGGRRLAVLRATRMPSVLVELGFLTNADDLTDLLDPAKRAAIVDAIVAGTEAWVRPRRIA